MVEGRTPREPTGDRRDQGSYSPHSNRGAGPSPILCVRGRSCPACIPGRVTSMCTRPQHLHLLFLFLAGGFSLATGALHATHGRQPSADGQQEREYKHASSLAPQAAAGPWRPESPVGPSSAAHRGRPGSALCSRLPLRLTSPCSPMSWSQSLLPGNPN